VLQVKRIPGEVSIDSKHRYWLDTDLGPFPSTTTIISGSKGRFYAKGAAERGTRVHEACEAYDRYGEVFADLDIALYVEAWQDFRASMGDRLEIESIEEKFIAEAYGVYYGGTADRLVILDGKMWVLDIKSGAYDKWHPLQLAAYGAAFGINSGLDVYVGRAGLYKVSAYEDLSEYVEEFGYKLRGLQC